MGGLRRRLRAAAGVALLAALAGCSGLLPGSSDRGRVPSLSAAPASPVPNKARVYLVLGQRHAGPMSQQLNDAVWTINDHEVGAQASGEILVADLAAGRYRFAWQAPWLPRPAKGVKGVAREQASLWLEAGDSMIVFAQLEQIAGLTEDDYRMWVEVGSRAEASRPPPGTLLAANVGAIPQEPLDPPGIAPQATPAVAAPAAQAGAPVQAAAPIAVNAPAAGSAPAPSSVPPGSAGVYGPNGTATSSTGGAQYGAPYTAPCGNRPIAERLRELESLARQGLLTPEEYAGKRRAILNCL